MALIQGIIFDMDNTLLRSKIDFELMKRDVYDFLVGNGVLDDELSLPLETTATIVRRAMLTNRMNEALLKDMWAIARGYEVAGMEGADLEDGVTELLSLLKGKYRLAIVTNNSIDAAMAALEENNIAGEFDLIVGREHVIHLKPSPDAFRYVLNYFGDLPAQQWISVGDAWIDGKASQAAGVKFIAYRSDESKLNRNEVYPDGRIEHIGELANFLT